MRTLPELAYLRIEQNKTEGSILSQGWWCHCWEDAPSVCGLWIFSNGFFLKFGARSNCARGRGTSKVHSQRTPQPRRELINFLLNQCLILFPGCLWWNQWLMQSCKDWSGICNANCSFGCHLAFCILSLSAFQLMRGNSRTFWNKTAWNGEIAKEGGTVKAQIWDTAGQERCSLWLWHMALRHGLFSWFFQLCWKNWNIWNTGTERSQARTIGEQLKRHVLRDSRDAQNCWSDLNWTAQVGALLVYDITREGTFKSCTKWMEERGQVLESKICSDGELITEKQVFPFLQSCVPPCVGLFWPGNYQT